MAPTPSLDERLARLHRLGQDDPTSAEAIEHLRGALKLKTNLVIAKAADLVGEHEIESLGKAVAAAFTRLIAAPAKQDPGCVAKTSCARALGAMPGFRFEARDAVFAPGLRHVQMEPVYGGRVDTAGELRGVCIHGLALAGDPRAMSLAADLLADPEPAARRGAVHAAGLSSTAAVPLIRLAVRKGEDHPDVLHEMLTALIDLEPDEGFALVREVLDETERGDTAALVLGESGHEQALAVLTDTLGRTLDTSSRSILITAIAMLRHAASRRFLLELIREGSQGDAEQTIQALSYFKHEDGLLACIREVAAGRGLDRHIAQAFGE
ncbi:MAG: hypothetical protein AAF333_04915 [Planctomycetota bacterium]